MCPAQMVENVVPVHTTIVIGIVDWPYQRIADRALNFIFLNKNYCIFIQMSLKSNW